MNVMMQSVDMVSQKVPTACCDVYNRQRRPLTARAIHEHENPQSPQTSPSKKPRPSSAPSTPKPYRDSKITSNNRALNMENPGCSQGTYSLEAGTIYPPCVPCPPGTYSAAVNQVRSCTGKCSSGKYSS